MRRRPSRNLVVGLSLALISATVSVAALVIWRGRRAEALRAHMDFVSPASLQGLTWKCHTLFVLGRDSSLPYLETTTYEGTPGLELPWLNGDWRPFGQVCLRGVLPDGDSARFHLSVWDGEGAYESGNRLRLDFGLNREWGRRCADLKYQERDQEGDQEGHQKGGHPIHTPSGRRFDLARVQRVVLFTEAARLPFRFRLATVDLEP